MDISDEDYILWMSYVNKHIEITAKYPKEKFKALQDCVVKAYSSYLIKTDDYDEEKLKHELHYNIVKSYEHPKQLKAIVELLSWSTEKNVV